VLCGQKIADPGLMPIRLIIVRCRRCGVTFVTKGEHNMTMQAVPISKNGSCPAGYHSDGNMCVPNGPST